MKTKKKVSRYVHKINSSLQASQWNSRLGKHEYTHRRMPFGKYVNWFMKDLPLDYLKWSILNLEAGELVDYLIRELQRRDPSFK